MLSVQVSADGEEVLYKACMNAGITMLSIGLMRHSPHSTVSAVGAGVCRWRGGAVQGLHECRHHHAIYQLHTA